jgi:hypothetical protein
MRLRNRSEVAEGVLFYRRSIYPALPFIMPLSHVMMLRVYGCDYEGFTDKWMNKSSTYLSKIPQNARTCGMDGRKTKNLYADIILIGDSIKSARDESIVFIRYMNMHSHLPSDCAPYTISHLKIKTSFYSAIYNTV